MIKSNLFAEGIRTILFKILNEKSIDYFRYVKLSLKLNKLLKYENTEIFGKNFSEFYEPETYLISHFLKKKQSRILIDIGANYGIMSFLLSKLSGNETRVLAFEPVTRTFNILKKIIKRFNLKNVIPIKKALGKKEEIREIFIPLQHTAEAYISRGNSLKRKNGISEKIVVTTLDKFLRKNNLSGVNFIKCDVEGFELNVFKGAEKTLKRDKPLVFVEVEERHLNKYGIKKNEIIIFFEKINYLCYGIKKNKLLKTKTILENISIYFFIHKKLTNQIESFINN